MKILSLLKWLKTVKLVISFPPMQLTRLHATGRPVYGQTGKPIRLPLAFLEKMNRVTILSAHYR
jgi:hypothetical protein